jgi:hypothetical protein
MSDKINLRDKLKVVRQALELARDVREASTDDGLIDDAEAAAIVGDALGLAQGLLGKVKVSESAKNLLRATAEQVIDLLK